jgi:transcriptional regulator with XRE-family HTH domain
MAKYKSFGQHLREERKRLSQTVEMIAKVCGTSRSYITLIENGHRQPGKKVLPKIAAALHLKTVTVLNWYLDDLRKKLQ